ncbi:hypothetical protein SDRG_13612 [Saprolegnia diclina VS20]|uniref:Uncharacterized protein n=1 Tax=Saprolegnia diclina (strain VS20) TaxID=1156394 RepID=T0PSR1_SAPDV|nr:hypothetical protein SDRG_13612 [Saprolegnia diclina VS20]EQC28534.1 hypothetical protein SDRG_13612 [Saprolegnia diclina VS20]|eukprot:XP_008617931.1 hypothetical protein SDRG_13612 [Saprolegnia diclina VS20]
MTEVRAFRADLTSDDWNFHGYDFKELEAIYASVLRRRAKRGVKSIRNPRGYYLLASRYARKDPLPLHVIEPKPKVMASPSKKISSFAEAYVDPNILEYIRCEWWPLAHFNPILFKRNHNIPITKDDYIRFSAKLFRGLLPDIGFPEVLHLVENDWAIDLLVGASATTPMPTLMDIHLFTISLLDLATACTAGALDTIFLFLQEAKIKFRLAHEFAEIPKLHYSELSAPDETRALDPNVVLVDHGKTYTHSVAPNALGSAPSHHIALFPTKVPLIVLCLALDMASRLDLVVRAVDSRAASQDAVWQVENVPAALVLYKPSEADITSLQFETLRVRVLPTTSSSAETTYHVTCVLLEPAALEFKTDFYGSVAAKRVRVFAFTHEQPNPAQVSLSVEPTSAKPSAVFGCMYLVKHDVTGAASYRYQSHAILHGNERTYALSSAPMTGLFYAVLFSTIELRFLLSYGGTAPRPSMSVTVVQRPASAAATTEASIVASETVAGQRMRDVSMATGPLPDIFEGTQIDVRARPSSSLRSKIYSSRLHSSQEAQAKLADARRDHVQETTTRAHTAPQRPRTASDRPKQREANRDVNHEAVALRSYFAHMATTQPTLAELRARTTEKEARLHTLQNLKGQFDVVYSDDELFKQLARAPDAELELEHGVFGAEEYQSTAMYLGDLVDGLHVKVALQEKHNATLQRYVASPTKAFESPDEVSDMQRSLVQDKLLRFPPRVCSPRHRKHAAPMVLPKQLLATDLPWQPIWQVHIETRDAVGKRKPSPPKSPMKPPRNDADIETLCTRMERPMVDDFSMLTSILAQKSEPEPVVEAPLPETVAEPEPSALRYPELVIPEWKDPPSANAHPTRLTKQTKTRQRSRHKSLIRKLPWSRLYATESSAVMRSPWDAGPES